MKIRFQYIIAIVAFAGMQNAFAQKDDQDLGTEVVNVVKPYTPTISDAFKVKETPVIEEEQDTQKEDIKYNIFSFPVASTFAPAKGKAASVDREAKEKLYNNYATLGVGNYGTINAELFVTHNLNRNEYVGGMLRHLSSQGGIDGVLLEDKYAITGLDLTYGNRQATYNWSTDLGYQNQIVNWYGLVDRSLLPPFMFFEPEEVGDPKQTYHTFYIGGNIAAEKSFFREASAQYKRFWDAYGSAENRFFIKPALDVDIMEEKIKVDFVADYVGGTLGDDTINPVEYSYFNLGLQPSLLYQKGDISVQLGAGIFYSMGKLEGESDSKIYLYPQVKASYKVVGDLMILYAGAEGALHQNSYADFVSANPFVMPSLYVAPTDRKFDIYGGLKGKLAGNVAYNLRASYMNEDDKAMFINSTVSMLGSGDVPPYLYGNSFGLVYDSVKTLSFFGELKADFESFDFGINGTFNSYDTDQMEAWNLPQIQVGASLDVDITPKWSAGTDVFFVSERKDIINGPDFYQIVDLDSYFDLNAHLNYKYSERLTGFLKLNNITNQDYQRWYNYPVQGFQFLLGASYKFNF